MNRHDNNDSNHIRFDLARDHRTVSDGQSAPRAAILKVRTRLSAGRGGSYQGRHDIGGYVPT